MAVFFTLLLGLAALLLGYYLYDFGRQNFVRETEAAIDMEIAHILTVTKTMGASERLSYIDSKVSGAELPVYYLQNKMGTRVAGNVWELPAKITRLTEGVLMFEMALGDTPQQMAAKIYTFKDGYRLLIARNVTDIIKNNEKLKVITLLVISFMSVVVAVSFFISVFVVGRINNIARTARIIEQTGDLSRRIAVKGNWDDLSNLAQILNGLFNRIEQLMQGIRDVSDNIAHDLRTPLTRLRTHLEAMQPHERNKDQLQLAIAEADSLLDTFHALLRIANIEKGKRLSEFTDVDGCALMRDVIELYEPLAEDKKVHLEAHLEEATLRGDRDLLFQAFANILDNAIKFSPEGATISIRLNRHINGQYCISIADKGIGVSEHEREKVFNRFYRSDKSRHMPGSGLGLSLVFAVMDLHKADISLTDNEPGLCVNIVI